MPCKWGNNPERLRNSSAWECTYPVPVSLFRGRHQSYEDMDRNECLCTSEKCRVYEETEEKESGPFSLGEASYAGGADIITYPINHQDHERFIHIFGHKDLAQAIIDFLNENHSDHDMKNEEEY